jgi:hypothetical protein
MGGARSGVRALPAGEAALIEIACEACGWLAVTSQPAHHVWAEHEAACPAVGGAVRHMPELPPMPMLLPQVRACTHRLVRRQIAVTAAGVKRYAVVCELCGRRLGAV